MRVSPYLHASSPELNPIERVWKLTRRRCLHNCYFAHLGEVIQAIESEFAHWIEPNSTSRRLCAMIEDATYSNLKWAATVFTNSRLSTCPLAEVPSLSGAIDIMDSEGSR